MRVTAELRSVVQRAIDEDGNVLIVPLLLSYGGIEEGIKEAVVRPQLSDEQSALLPDERLAQWVPQSVKNRDSKLKKGVRLSDNAQPIIKKEKSTESCLV